VSVANRDSTPHTFTADDGHSFDSGTIDPGGTATIKALPAGTYPYHCSIHDFMKGKLVVR
jgi:plastocyanin